MDIVRFCPGGSTLTTVVLVRVRENMPVPEMLIEGARLVQDIGPNLQFHTRSMRAEFKSKINNIARVSPADSSFKYQEMTSDASCHPNPIVQERIRLIYLGNTGIVADFRTLNSGRSAAFDALFQKLKEVVENSIAADDRRHNV